MVRNFILALGLVSAPALAAPHYQAEPAASPAAAKFVVKNIVWTCGEASCAGGKGNSRPAVVCASLAREIGALRSFSAGGQALAGEELDKCNARARKGDGEGVYAAQK